jgi:hypothetical protein
MVCSLCFYFIFCMWERFFFLMNIISLLFVDKKVYKMNLNLHYIVGGHQICYVLYPRNATVERKLLWFKQEYTFCSTLIQDIIACFKECSSHDQLTKLILLQKWQSKWMIPTPLLLFLSSCKFWWTLKAFIGNRHGRSFKCIISCYVP